MKLELSNIDLSFDQNSLFQNFNLKIDNDGVNCLLGICVWKINHSTLGHPYDENQREIGSEKKTHHVIDSCLGRENK